MKKLFTILIFATTSIFTQNAPIVEPVYGGRVEVMDAITLSATETRVFIAPNSENTLFYTDISGIGTSATFTSWTAVPDFDYTNSMGEAGKLEADENSQFAFLSVGSGLYGTDIIPGSSYLIDSGIIEALEVHGGKLYYIKYDGSDMNLYVSDIDPITGAVGTAKVITITARPSTTPRFPIDIIVNPYNDYVYVFIPGVAPEYYKSSDVTTSLSTSTAFSLIATTDLTTSGHDYVASEIAPDGRIFASSFEGYAFDFDAWMAYSDDDGISWTISTMTIGAGRGEMSIVGNSSNYIVHYSQMVSSDKGITWSSAPHADGALVGDPNDCNIAYVRTDWGVGIFDVSANAITEANDGFLAVEVKALGMNVGKSKAWVATKSGVFYVYDYDTPSPVWSSPIWPLGDSYPYTASVCDQTGDLAYLGNSGGNLYRYYVTNGAQDDVASYELIFAAEDDSAFPDWTWTYGTKISAIAIDHTTSSERIFVGLYDEEDWDETTDHNGAIFMGENISGTWTWTQITSSIFPDGLDVFDIIAVSEGGNTVLYVGVMRNTAFATTTNGIYRIEETSPGIWSATEDLYQSAGFPLAASILDIAKSSTNTLYICGTDASISSPVIYKKAIGDTYWQVIPSIGFAGDELVAKSITFDNISTTYIAVDNKIFEDATIPGSWTKYFEYPLGTEINFIYYDDLLVGTGVGLFMHPEDQTDIEDNANVPEGLRLEQNYPNPFNPSTTIRFSIPKNVSNVHCQLTIYNALGEEVANIVNQTLQAGNHEIIFNASNLASGIYYYKLQSGKYNLMKQMVLLK